MPLFSLHPCVNHPAEAILNAYKQQNNQYEPQDPLNKR